jgi:hypothetical protein
VTRLDLTTNQESVVQEAVPKLPEERRDRQIGRPGYENNRSSDGKWEVILREGEVVLKDLKAGTEKVMAKSDEAGVFRGVAYWSPNSQFFQLWKAKEVAPRKVTYVRSSPEKQLQPETFTVDYPKPGDEITVSLPWIFAGECTFGGRSDFDSESIFGESCGVARRLSALDLRVY